MKRLFLGGAGILFACTALVMADIRRVDFNNSNISDGDLIRVFSQTANGPGGGFTPASSGGIANSGCIETTSGDGTTAVYNEKAIDLAPGQTVNMSLSFYFGESPQLKGGDRIIIQLGLVPDEDGDLRLASDYVAVRLCYSDQNDSNQIMVIGRSSDSLTALNQKSQFLLEEDRWYNLTVSITPDGGGSLLVGAKIEDIGTDGRKHPSLLVEFSDVFIQNDILASAANAFAAFRGDKDSGALRYDDFAVTKE